MQATDDKTPDEIAGEESGETSISGSTPDPESDDDLLQDVHDVGEQLGEDEEHPKEIDIARDINKTEEYQQTH